MKYLLLCSMFFLSSCGSTTSINNLLVKHIIAPISVPLSPSSILKDDGQIITDYYLTFTRGDDIYNFLMHMEIARDRFSLIGFGLLGEVLFECYGVTDIKCDKIVDGIPAMMLLKDIQIVYWPHKEVNYIINNNFKISDGKMSRMLYHNNDLYSRITYDNLSRISSNVELVNIKYNYNISIKSLRADRIEKQ